MASASAIRPIQIEETQSRLSGISKYLSAASVNADASVANVRPYRQDYGIAPEEMLTSPDSSYRPSPDVDKNVDLQCDLREVAVNLGKFDYIIERIENLRFVRRGENAPRRYEVPADWTFEGIDEVACLADELYVEHSPRLEGRVGDRGSNKSVYESVSYYEDDGTFERLIGTNDARKMSNFEASDERCLFFGDVEPTDENNSDARDTSEAQSPERGPVRPRFPSPRSQPYAIPDRSSRSPRNDQTSGNFDFDITAERILKDKDYRDKLSPCLDRLSSPNQDLSRSPEPGPDHEAKVIDVRSTQNERLVVDGGAWNTSKKDEQAMFVDGVHRSSEAAPLPSIVIDDHEDSFLHVLTSNHDYAELQPRQIYADGSSAASSSTLTPRNWPDSPVSGTYNVATSRASSCCSSRAQSPGSGLNMESPLTLTVIGASPVGSPQIVSTHRVPAGLSSSSSSNHSFSETPSPLNYQASLGQRAEEQLCEDLECLPVWRAIYGSSSSCENDRANETVNGIDSNELQFVEQVLRDLGGKYDAAEEPQVVPNSHSCPGGRYKQERCASLQNPQTSLSPVAIDYAQNVSIGSNLTAGSTACDARDERIDGWNFNYAEDVGRKDVAYVCEPQVSSYTNNTGSFACPFAESVNTPVTIDAYGSNASEKLYDRSSLAPSVFNCRNESKSVQALHQPVLSSTTGKYECASLATSSSSMAARSKPNQNLTGSSSMSPATESVFNDFQIPETVTGFKPSRSFRRQERNIVPWPSLRLPSVRASERLKEGLNPKDVEKAMTNLLKRPLEELARADEDGDTMLMCLVGNPDELTKKKAYLAPLVERLGNIRGALSKPNHRGEDALYLAAMNCPQMSYVTGYLAAAMLQKGIDINQKLYHTRGDTLIHSIAARGDSHGEVLAELLALKTVQGHPVFDLSKRNYDGRTALHVAVESHSPAGKGISAIAMVRLLLENGADPKIKETKCGDTALHMATSLSCDPALVKALLVKSSQEIVNATNYNYNTPLHMAAAVSSTVNMDKQREVCRLLIQAGAHCNVQNRQGKTPLALVCAERKDTIKRIFYRK